MSKKFRNSLFGFNRDDVLSFVIEAKDNETKNRKTIEELTNKVSKLTASYEEMSHLQTQTSEILKKTEQELDAYKQREEAITRLSESIGKLYLVAQSNANAIMSSANDSAKKAKAVTEQNISVASVAECDLEEIGRVLNNKTQEYLTAIAELKQQLADAKKKINENDENIAERNAEFSSVTKSK